MDTQDVYSGLVEAERRITQCSLSRDTQLDLKGLRLSFLPRPLRELTHLRTLIVSNNSLFELPEWMGELVNLVVLDCTKNALTKLPSSVSQLAKLNTLYLGFNHFKAIPDVLALLPSLERLTVVGNYSLEIPTEVARSGDARSIVDYSLRIATSTKREPVNEFKLVLVGRGGVGKTSLAHRLKEDTFVSFERTPGIHITSWILPVGGRNVRAHIWDFGGQEILHGSHRMFLTERAVYLILISGRESAEDYDAEYWLSLVRSFAGEVPIIVLLHRFDEFRFELTRKLLKDKFGSDIVFIETDSVTGRGLSALRDSISELANTLPGIHAPWPVAWHNIKKELPEVTRSWITYDEFCTFCTARGVAARNEQDMLAGHLHTLGLMLSYQKEDNLRGFGVLNPLWVTRGIYEIITSEQLRAQGGEVAVHMLKEIFPIGDSLYSENDILNPQALFDHIGTPNRHTPLVTDFGEKWLVNIWSARREPVSTLKGVLAAQLNFLLNSDLLEDHFSDISFPSEIREAFHRTPRGLYKRRLNRQVLDFVFHKEVAPLHAADAYPPEVHSFLISLLQKFKLCHPLNQDFTRFLIPELLSKEEPFLNLPFHREECLCFLYRYDSVLPEGLIPAFIVETYVHRKHGLVWRGGVVLERGNCKALIRSDIQGRIVEIRVAGVGSGKRELLGIIREHFDRLHSRYKHLPITQLVPLPQHPEVCVEHELLLKYEKSGRKVISIVVADAVTDFKVDELLEGVDLPGMRIVRSERNADGAGRRAPPLRVFVSYCHKDVVFLDQLRAALVPYERTEKLAIWVDSLLKAGERWKKELTGQIEQADIFILLVSSDALASKFVIDYELDIAMERNRQGLCDIVPVVVRACRFDLLDLGQVQAVLPFERPLSLSPDRDSAWMEVTKQLDRVIEKRCRC